MTNSLTITREHIENLKPGLELDALIAEHVFRWRRIKGPSFDYDGPCESNDALIPPTMKNNEAFGCMPPRGAIPLTYFVNRGWSTDRSRAWEVLDNFKQYNLMRAAGWEKEYECRIWVGITGDQWSVQAKTAAESICKAALLAALKL